MYRTLALQAVCALVAVLAASVVYGLPGVLAAMLGSLACLLPNVLFVLWLRRGISGLEAAQAIRFLCGEFAKIALSVFALLAIAWLYPEVQWGAVVMGLAITLQANFLVFLVKP